MKCKTVVLKFLSFTPST